MASVGFVVCAATVIDGSGSDHALALKNADIAHGSQYRSTVANIGGKVAFQFLAFDRPFPAELAVSTINSIPGGKARAALMGYPFPEFAKVSYLETNEIGREDMAHPLCGHHPECKHGAEARSYQFHLSLVYAGDIQRGAWSPDWGEKPAFAAWALKHFQPDNSPALEGVSLTKFVEARVAEQASSGGTRVGRFQLLLQSIAHRDEVERARQAFLLQLTQAATVGPSPALPTPLATQPLLQTSSAPTAAASATGTGEVSGSSWDSRIEAYLQACSGVLEKKKVGPAECICKGKTPPPPPVVRCAECTGPEEFSCLSCAVDIHDDLTRAHHTLTHLCPSCGTFGLLFTCPACGDAATIRCSECLQKAHKRIRHEYSYEALQQVTHALLCGSIVPDPADSTPRFTSVVTQISAAPRVGYSPSTSPVPSQSPLHALVSSPKLDPEYVYMVEARAVIEKIAQNVVIECFRQRWMSRPSTEECKGCKTMHTFKMMGISCLKWVVTQLPGGDSAKKCVNALSYDVFSRQPVADVLHKYFDLGALCNFMKELDRLYFPQMASDAQAFADLTALRAKAYHKQAMSDTGRDDVVNGVKASCLSLLQRYPHSDWNGQRIDDELKAIAEHGGNVMHEFREQIIRECYRDVALQASKLMATQGAHVEHSRQIANVLLDSQNRRVLVIPPLHNGRTDEEVRKAARQRLQYLFDLSWIAVLDLNQLYNDDPSNPDAVDAAAFGGVKVATELGQDHSSYGETKMLYTTLPAQVALLRNHFIHVPCYFIVAVLDCVDDSRAAMQTFSVTLTTITSAQFVNENNWKVMPIVSSAHLHGSPGLREVLIPFVERAASPTTAAPLRKIWSFGRVVPPIPRSSKCLSPGELTARST